MQSHEYENNIRAVGGALGLGLAVAVGGGLSLGGYMGERTPEEIAASEVVTVLVAAEDIPQGTIVYEPKKLFVKKQIPLDALPPCTVVTDMNEVQSMGIDRALKAGSICSYRRLASLLAFTLRVSLDEPIARQLEPGRHVDILVRVPSQGDPSKRVRKLLVQDVFVLAVSQPDNAPEENPIGPIIRIVAVRPSDAEILSATMADGGTFVMVLHQPGREQKDAAP